MSKQLSVETMVCSEYQRLLEESQSALEIWNEYRAEIGRSRLIGKEAGDGLLRLQAKFARAYTVLQNHMHNCLRCQLVSRIAGSGQETREWIGDTAERKFKVLRRKGRRSIRHLEYAAAKGEEKVKGVLRSGKEVLESVAAKLD